MKLKLVREKYLEDRTMGRIFINECPLCFTLEDTVRKLSDPKIPGKTAIQSGIYKVIVNMSNRFKRRMPLLLDVPNFTGIRIHGGNTPMDTEGCIIVAFNLKPNFDVQGTAETYITMQLEKEIDNTIEIVDYQLI